MDEEIHRMLASLRYELPAPVWEDVNRKVIRLLKRYHEAEQAAMVAEQQAFALAQSVPTRVLI